MLNVSAPFHSSLMEPAAQKLKKVLDKIEIKDAEIPVIANVNALAETKEMGRVGAKSYCRRNGHHGGMRTGNRPVRVYAQDR